MEKQHVFLVGAKSLGAYGGYETFIDKLTEYHQDNKSIQYHVAVKANGQGAMDTSKLNVKNGRFTYHNADCFMIHIPEKLGPAQALYYDCKALDECIKTIKKDRISHPIVYIMACRIGPWMKKYYGQIKKLGGKVFLNPDGHEWMRAKWSVPVRKYWKVSEQMMIKYSNLAICDSLNIEKYIHEQYDGKGIGGANPQTTFIAYGAETRKSRLADDDKKLLSWYQNKGLRSRNYFLVVGRFVPENNYETMIREFMRSKTTKDFALITNVNDKFLDELEQKLHFKNDPRIKFVGTVYDKELLMKIRENAYGYFHGHEVGGTNPSLLEALGSTDLNLLLDVGFNREVAEDNALYWSKADGDLAGLIDKVDQLEDAEIEVLGTKSTQRIKDAYSWKLIARAYEKVWLGEVV